METHSYHIFMFPFRLEVKDSNCGKEKKFDLFKHFEPIINLDDWQDATFDSEILKYNHEKFFYDFKILQDSDTGNPSNKDLVIHKSFKNIEAATYYIHIKAKVKEIAPEPLLKNTIPKKHLPKFEDRKFELKIEKICLDIYPNEVGVLSFHLKNVRYKNAEDILLINQYGRRIYPPFKDTCYKDFETKLKDELDGTKYRELAMGISIKDTISDKEIKEYSEEFKETGSNMKFRMPGHFSFLFKNTNNIEIKPLLDDRMFVMCWYGSFQLGDDFKILKKTRKQEIEKFKYCISEITKRVNGGYEVTSAYRNTNQHRSFALNTSFDGYGYATNDFWYQYVFVDSSSPSCANELLQKKQMLNHTYDRWVENNTLYGISRFSFVCITEPFSSLCSPEINAAFIPEHLKTLYFRMTALVLAQRASILGFSKMISEISFEKLKENEHGEREKALHIYQEYRRFINEIYYREVTAQEQGIELYDMLQEHLRIKEQAKELEKEFIEMNRLVDLIGTNETNKRMRVLTVMGSAFAIFSILLGLQGSHYFEQLNEFSFSWNFLELFCFDCAYPIILIGAIAYFLINGLMLWYKEEGKRFYFLALSAIFFFAYLATYKMQPAVSKFIVSVFIVTISIVLTWKITFFYKKK